MSNNYICVPNKFMDELNGIGGNGFVVSLAFMYRSYEEWNGQTIFKNLKDIMELTGIKKTTILNSTIEDLKARELVTSGRKKGLSKTISNKLYNCEFKYSMYYQKQNEGYFKYPLEVLKHKDITSNDKMVYGYLLRLYGSMGNDNVYPKVETMAEKLCISESTVKRSIAKLQKLEYLAVLRIQISKGRGEIKTKNYYKPRLIILDERLIHLDKSVNVSIRYINEENFESMTESYSEVVFVETDEVF